MTQASAAAHTPLSYSAPTDAEPIARKRVSASQRKPARPARVLIVETNADGTVGGSYQVLFDLAVGLDRTRFEPVALFYQDNVFVKRLRARGVEVVVFDEVASRERALTKVRRPLANLLGLGAAVIRRRRELRRLRIDLLHLNNAPGVGNDDWLPAARLAGIPCVVSAMGLTERPRRSIHRWLYRRFDLYLAVSKCMASQLLEYGVNPNRIELVYPGVDLEFLRARVSRPREAVRAELGIRPEELFVLMVGNIRAWKGQREVIAALRMLPPRVRNRLRVFLAGATASADSSYEAALRDDVAAGLLTDTVTFLGSRSDVADLYAAADIAVHASKLPEPFGLVVPEAMAFNCAVVAASFGGPAEIITPGTGFLCDPSVPQQYAQVFEQLTNNDSLRHSVALAASDRAAFFNIERSVHTTQRAYSRVLQTT